MQSDLFNLPSIYGYCSPKNGNPSLRFHENREPSATHVLILPPSSLRSQVQRCRKSAKRLSTWPHLSGKECYSQRRSNSSLVFDSILDDSCWSILAPSMYSEETLWLEELLGFSIDSHVPKRGANCIDTDRSCAESSLAPTCFLSQ